MKRIDTIALNKFNKLKSLESVNIKVKSVSQLQQIKQEENVQKPTTIIRPNRS